MRHVTPPLFSKALSPSDPHPAPPFLLVGRIVACEGGRAVIADAFDEREVASIHGVSPGDLVEIEVVALDAESRCIASSVRVVGRDVRGDRGGGERQRLLARDRSRNLRTRARAIAAVRRFFEMRGYLEVETPIVVPSPGMDLHLDAFEIRERDVSRFLITSPEYQMKRLLAGGMPRIFQIAKCFRRGEVGARHNPEFTMVEWYRAFSGVEEMIEETEALIVDVAESVRGAREVVVGDRTIALSPPFERLPVARAFARHTKLDEEAALALALSTSAGDEERFFRLFVDEVEPALAKGPPVALVDWPVTQASLARKKPDDPRVAERFEILVGGVELCNGFGELVDPVEQRRRFETDRVARAAAHKRVLPLDEKFLSALEEGVPPSAGNALGLDRLIAIAIGAREIGDVLTFPDGPGGWL